MYLYVFNVFLATGDKSSSSWEIVLQGAGAPSSQGEAYLRNIDTLYKYIFPCTLNDKKLF